MAPLIEMGSCSSSEAECSGAYVQSILWSYVYPFCIVFGLVINSATVILFERGTLALPLLTSPPSSSSLSKTTLTGKGRKFSIATTRRSSSGAIRFSGPGYTFIEAMAVNSLVYFITLPPLVLARCCFTFCGWATGFGGYTLASMVFFLDFFINDVVHWANVCTHFLACFSLVNLFNFKFLNFVLSIFRLL